MKRYDMILTKSASTGTLRGARMGMTTAGAWVSHDDYATALARVASLEAEARGLRRRMAVVEIGVTVEMDDDSCGYHLRYCIPRRFLQTSLVNALRLTGWLRGDDNDATVNRSERSVAQMFDAAADALEAAKLLTEDGR